MIASIPRSPTPAFAYDTRAGVWREWQFGKGWQDRGSVLDAMTNIVAALCALEAYRTNDSGSPDKTEREYKKLRQRYLGATVEKAVTLAAVETGVGSWDYDPNTLGLPKGEAVYIAPSNKTFPVHTGLEQLPTDYLTRKMAHGPKRTTRLWLDFLDSLTGGDLVLENALQVWTGAALLRGNDHHKAHILFGDGRTGKSTFLKMVQTAMGDYAASARPSIFVDEKANHPAELLPFVNHRLVVLPELPRGALRSDLLKTVTGGDAISVRGMRQNPRTETPAATLMFSCNELPSIRMVDNALRGRIMIWPSDNQPTKIDPTLGSRLQEPEHLAGVVGRGFMACEVAGRPAFTDALTQAVMEMIGRSLIRLGQVVFLIDTRGGRIQLLPAETHDVEGGPYPDSWEYRITLGGPSRTHTRDYVPASSVLHFKYAVDPTRPWRGNGPVQVASLAGSLSAETVKQLLDEASGPVGRLLGIPKDSEDGTVDTLKTDIRDARGRVALLEVGDWGNAGAGTTDLESKRFGAEPPQSLVNLHTMASHEIMNACGLNHRPIR